MNRNMRSAAVSRGTLALGTAIAMTMAGCGTSPTTHFYTLSIIPQSAASIAPAALQGSVALGTITLPRILDQPEIARRTGPNQLDYAEYERWASSLEDLVRHALAGDLSTELGMAVLPTANAPGGKPQRTVQLYLSRFEADSAGTVFLTARWTVSGMDYPPSVSVDGHAEITTPSDGQSAAAIAQTMSRALGSLGSQIATTVQAAKMRPPPAIPGSGNQPL